MTQIRIHNTLSGKKELLQKPKGRPLRLFVCGPTVYDYLHIGNARSYIVFDAFVKYLRSQGAKVFYLQNITDIDDKIIVRAKEEKTSPAAIAKKYTAIYMRNMKSLGIDSVDTYAPATKYIPQIVRQVKTLLQKGCAYEISGDGIYFDIKSFPDYGKLARRTVLHAEDGVSRIDESVEKRNKGDFALWKFIQSPSEPSWPSDLDRGRPGWHIEDTAISEHYFGPQYDIHGAGVDLKFPHHEAEIAQQESASGKKPFVKIWMHVGTLLVRGKKMSKSLGNYLSVDDFLAHHAPKVLRILVLRHHYRSPLNYTEEILEESERVFDGMRTFIGKLRFIERTSPFLLGHAIPPARIKQWEEGFLAALSDDFNTPLAFGTFFEFMNLVQLHLYSLSRKETRSIRESAETCLGMLGLRFPLSPIPQEARVLAKEREKFRTNKQFVQSDTLRKEIYRLGYVVEDTPLGQFISPRL